MHKKIRSDCSVASDRSTSSVGDSRQDTIGRSGSFFKSLGKMVEKAVDNSVLGVSLPADDNYDSASDYYESESEVLSSVVSNTSTTLQERIAMQRERQVAFLKNKGLIDDESSIRGGAGASGSVADSPNSKSPTPRRSLKSALSARSPVRWSPRREVREADVAQDEV